MRRTNLRLLCGVITAVFTVSAWAHSTRGAAAAPWSTARQSSAAPAKHRVFFNRYQVPMMTLFIADADGKNERPLHSRRELEYSPLFSADGQWIVFTKDQSGQADIFRVHSDGTGMEQLTDDPAFDDRGMPSPDGKTLAFVSTRHGGTANIWLMDLATRTSTKGAALLQPPIVFA